MRINLHSLKNILKGPLHKLKGEKKGTGSASEIKRALPLPIKAEYRQLYNFRAHLRNLEQKTRSLKEFTEKWQKRSS